MSRNHLIFLRSALSCSPLRLLYHPAQLLTVSPSNTLHGEAYCLFSSQELGRKKKTTKSQQTLKTTPRNKQRPLTTLMGRETYSPLNAAGFPFHDLLAGLPMAAASWLSYGCAWLSHFPPNSLAVIAANERATILAWTVMGRCQGGTPVICCMCLSVCVDLHLAFQTVSPIMQPFP